MKHGDIVDVYWENIGVERVIIDYYPDEEDPTWTCHRQDGTKIIINNFCKMVLVKSLEESGKE
jgi:hypothetical protein